MEEGTHSALKGFGTSTFRDECDNRWALDEQIMAKVYLNHKGISIGGIYAMSLVLSAPSSVARTVGQLLLSIRANSPWNFQVAFMLSQCQLSSISLVS